MGEMRLLITVYCVSFTACDLKQRIGFSWCLIRFDLDHSENALTGPDPDLKDQMGTSLLVTSFHIWVHFRIKARERSASGVNHCSQLVELSVPCAPALNTSPLLNCPTHKKERKNLHYILQAAISSYSLINPTFVFDVTAFKSNRNLEKKKKTKQMCALMQASHAHSSRSRHDVSATGVQLSGAVPSPLHIV